MNVTYGHAIARGRGLWRRLGFAVAVFVAVLVAVPAVLPTSQASATTAFSIATDPGLVPSFNKAIHNYVVPCTGAATTTLSTTGKGTVKIGGTSFAQPASVALPLVANQAVHVSNAQGSFVIRCLPADFPSYTSTVLGTAQAKGYIVAPTGAGAPANPYVIAFDNHGVPVWWMASSGTPFDAMFLSATQIGWWTGTQQCGGGCGSGSFTIRNLAGQVTKVEGNPAAGTGLDLHEFQLLPNGHYVGIQYFNNTADLSSWGLSSTAPITDTKIIEVTAGGKIVWSWTASQHIDIATENANWHGNYPDVVHMNSVQEVGNQVIMSSRHLDAVYDIDKTTGNILWKLGGTPTPQSLSVVGDSYPSLFSGQHDARMLPDGTVTVHDNATKESGYSARALRFQIDTVARTATILENVTDLFFPGTAPCCGSANRLTGGNWLVDWGTATYVAELTPTGQPVVGISYAPLFSYRAGEVMASDAALSNGMDKMFPPLAL
jgi:hypothetical protein